METLNYLREQNLITPDNICYPFFKYLPDGNIAYINRLAFTWGLHLLSKKDLSVPYDFRFCFPHLQDCVKAFNEVQSIFDVPTFGWCAARPESRILLPRDLIYFVPADRQVEADFLSGRIAPIDQLIENGLYSLEVFDKWVEDKLENQGFFIPDAGVIQFKQYLTEVQNGK